MTPISRGSRRRSQRGVALLFALVALAVLSLAAVALVRSVDTGAQVMGNLGFKMNATASGDQGAELAIAWLQNNLAGAGLDSDLAASGYYATSLDALDPTGLGSTSAARAVVDWKGDGCASVSGSYSACLSASTPTTVNGNAVSYLIARTCAVAGDKDAIGNSCATPLYSPSSRDPNSNSPDYSAPTGFDQTTTNPYFRIVVRSLGGRNSVSYTETLVHF